MPRMLISAENAYRCREGLPVPGKGLPVPRKLTGAEGG